MKQNKHKINGTEVIFSHMRKHGVSFKLQTALAALLQTPPCFQR